VNNNKKKFDEVTKFHGHVCPGSALGYVASKAGLELLSSNKSEDEEIVVIVENDSCAVDAVQVLTGCTFGKGNLIFNDYGKQSYTFLNRSSKKGVKLNMKSSFDVSHIDPHLNILRKKVSSGDASPHEKKELKELMEKVSKKIIEMPWEEIFEARDVKIDLPPKAMIFRSIECTSCGELVSEHRARVKNGELVCIPCFDKD
jgi:formylmethanofuran dehydrogenase subunit E